MMKPKEELQMIKDNPDTYKSILIEHNIDLAYSIAHKYHRITARQVDINDIISAAKIGISMAADRFDYTRTPYVKFTSYAYFWIKKYVTACITDEYENDFVVKTDKEGVKHRQHVVYLNANGSSDDPSELIDRLDQFNIEQGSYPETPAQITSRSDLVSFIYKFIDSKSLSSIERKILKARIIDNKTLGEIAKKFKRSTPGIRYIEQSALAKVREHVYNNELIQTS